MDEEEQKQSDSKISVSSFFERVDSADKVANSALSKANANLSVINTHKSLLNSINVSIEALQTKVRDIANYIIIQQKAEKDAEEDRLFEQQDEAQKGSMLERLAGLKSNNESEQTQAASEEPKKGGGGILGTLLTLGIGAFALKFLWPIILPLAGKLITGAIAKAVAFTIGGLGGILKGLIIGTLGGIGLFGIGKIATNLGNFIGDKFDKVKEVARNAIKNFSFGKDGKVDGADSLDVDGGGEGGEGGGEGEEEKGGLTDFGDDYKAQEEYYQSEEYRKTINEDGIGTSYEDMKKTLEKKDLIESSESSESSESTYKSEYTRNTAEGKDKLMVIIQEKINELEKEAEIPGADLDSILAEKDTLEEAKLILITGDPTNDSGGNDYLQNLIKEQNIEFDPQENITKEGEIKPVVDNEGLDLSLSETFSDKFLALDQQVDTLSEDFTGSINAEQGQMFSRPANSPNTTVTVFKQTSSNSAFTSLMSNKYLSLNKTLPPEVYRAIK